MSAWHYEKIRHVTGELNVSQVSVGRGLVEVDCVTCLVDEEQLSMGAGAESHRWATCYDLKVFDPTSDEVEGPEYVVADPVTCQASEADKY